MRCVFAQRRYSTSDKHKIQVLLYRYDDRTGRRIRRNTRRILVVLHGFKSKGSKTRSVDSKFAAPYIGSWPFVISRLRNNQVAFGAKQTSSSRQHRLDSRT